MIYFVYVVISYCVVKNAKNGSVSWGIRTAIKNVKTPYHAVYHSGDHAKEPMILICGKTPQVVLSKVARII